MDDLMFADEFLHVEELEVDDTPKEHTTTHELFQYARYDWANFNSPYGVIRLTKGYFAFVDKRDFKRLSKFKWQANVQHERGGERILKIYACRTVSVKKGKRAKVYLHRAVLNAGKAVVVDHTKGLSLDCRRSVLDGTNQGKNMATRIASRVTHEGLPRGVEVLRNGQYRGQIKIRGKTHRSPETWDPTPEGAQAAHRWYLQEFKKAYQCSGPAENGGEPDYPIFPPLKKQFRTRHIEASIASLTATF